MSQSVLEYTEYSLVPTVDMDDYYDDNNKFCRLPWEDQMGMTVTSGSLVLKKDSQNLIGISIGGGAPYCPCLYVVQIFDNTPAAKDGTLAAGDEIVGVNGSSVKGRTKVEVARMIQSVKTEVTINYNKLHADPKRGKSLDIILKKVKHSLVENMSSGTADALGLSRAILCNDGLVRRLQELEKVAMMYKGMMDHTKRLLRGFFDLAQAHKDGLVRRLQELEKVASMYRGMMNHTKKLLKTFFDLAQAHKAFGDCFAKIGVREPHPNASEAFTKFGDAHREIERYAVKMLKTCKPMISDLNTFLHKAVPDTRLTIKKYLDAKFEYLSYCLKVKEMDDEEYSYAALQEPLYRVETGNYEYRLVLRCRQEARTRFAKMRSDVLVKIELLDNKHVQDIVFQLQRLISAMAKYHTDCHAILKDAEVFPIEVDLSRSTFTYDDSNQFNDEEDEDEAADGVDEELAEEALEDRNNSIAGGAISGDLISTD